MGPTKKCLLVLSLLCALIVGCAGGSLGGPTPTPDPCSPTEIDKYLDAIRDVSRRFDDASMLANNTPRMSLPPVISDMQVIRRQAEDLKVPDCAATAKGVLVRYMNAVIDAFTAFLGQESDSAVSAHFDTASTLMDRYLDEMSRLGGD